MKDHAASAASGGEVGTENVSLWDEQPEILKESHGVVKGEDGTP